MKYLQSCIFIIIMASGQANKFLNPFRFEVEPQQTRELSVNLSLVTSLYNYQMTYEEILQFFKKYQSDHLDMPTLHSSPNLKLKKYKEAIYYGEFGSSKRQGIGIMLYNNGQIYQGEWSNDLRHGQGYEKFHNGCFYKGRYQRGHMQGNGKYVWTNGQVYQGEWMNNHKHGTGMWKNQKGDNFLGEWIQGEASGIGIFTQAQGNRYEGSFINFMKNGSGTQKFVSGDLYKGEYKEGKFDGYGQYYWNDGSYYKGRFKNGFRSGHGVWKRNQGPSDKYEGQFVNNKKQGYGIYTWQCGHIYKGHYHQNMRHGYGQIFWQDGGFYRGLWKNDIQEGQGELFTGEEKLIKGIFKEGELLSPEVAQKQPLPQKKDLDENKQKQKIRRILNTPIELINDFEISHKNEENDKIFRQTYSRKIYKEDQAKLIKINLNNKTIKNFPLAPDSLLKKKLIQSLQLRNNIKTNQTVHSQHYKVPQKNKTLDKIPHSAFQIHRLHRNKASNHAKNLNNLSTLDNQAKFAFQNGNAFRQADKSRERYYSRLQ